MKKISLAILMCMIMLASSYTVAHAETAGIIGTVTKTKVDGMFTYGKPGNILTIIINYTEKHKTTNQVYSSKCTNTVAGNYTSVRKIKNADAGYNYTVASFYGKYNSSQVACLIDVKP